MRVLYCTAGHSNKSGQDNGAVSVYGNEGIEARKLVTALAKELYKRNIMTYTDDDSWSLSNTIGWLGKTIKGSDYTIDIHFNASTNSGATGVEVLVPELSNDKEIYLATNVLNTIVTTLGLRSRGIKKESDSQHSKLGILSNAKLATANNILVEVCFISNANDMKAYKDNFDRLAINLANTIDKILK